MSSTFPEDSYRSGKARVLVIPGLDGDPALARVAAPRLFRDLRVLPFDHRLDAMAGGIDGLAERALAVLDRDSEADTPAFICGESFGGTAALTLAHRYTARVRGLILLSAFACYPSAFSPPPRLGLVLWRVLGDRGAEHFLRLWRPLSLRLVGDTLVGRRRAELSALRASVPARLSRKCEVSLSFDARPWLGAIQCPTLVLTGTLDLVVPTRAGAELARLIPQARLHRLRGGHLAHMARPAEAGQLCGWVRTTKTNLLRQCVLQQERTDVA